MANLKNLRNPRNHRNSSSKKGCTWSPDTTSKNTTEGGSPQHSQNWMEQQHNNKENRVYFDLIVVWEPEGRWRSQLECWKQWNVVGKSCQAAINFSGNCLLRKKKRNNGGLVCYQGPPDGHHQQFSCDSPDRSTDQVQLQL